MLKKINAEEIIQLTGAHPACIRPYLGSISSKNKMFVVTHACSQSTLNMETGRSEVRGHPQLYSEFETSLGV